TPTAKVTTGSGSTPPVNTGVPTIGGSAQVGQTLTAANGTWTGTAPISYTYQWNRCSPGCAAIPGATTGTYTVVSADLGATLTVSVKGTNSVGNATATSAQTATVTSASASPPVNTALPAVTGTAQVGQQLSVGNGTWTGTAPISYSYQWKRCGSGYASTVSADNPLSYWRLGEASGTTAADQQNRNAGTYLNGITLGAAGALTGDTDTAASFDGSNDAVSFANPALTGPFSIELWGFLTGPGSTGATGYATLLGYDYTHRILWDTSGTGGKLLTQFDGSFFSTVNLSKNAWHHIVYSWDGTTERFYIDGAAAGSHATTKPAWNAPFTLGSYDGSDYLFKGRLDEPALYNGALTPTQITNHYAARTGSSSCTPISGATTNTYTPVAADTGNTLTATVTATNSAGTANATSTPTAKVTP
ncbi:MAG: LamG domain-containing protein, partial [Actinobacteria bacterium]|nr:LamG domain-containing protein [Actinomycetota bacterium]